MSRQPWTIRADAKLSQAKNLMREHRIRHLPVLEGGKLIGMLSERDMLVFERRSVFDEEITVEDAMTVEVYAARSEDSVDSIAERMADGKYGSAVVLDRLGAVEGIFTTADGMRVLAEVLRRVTD